MRNTKSMQAVLVAALCTLAVDAWAGKGNTAPGKYEDWDDVDKVEIVKAFSTADYARVTVAPLETSGTTLPPTDENTHKIAKEMLPTVTKPFIAGIQAKLPGKAVAAQGAGGAAEGKELLVRGKLLNFDPGSKAARAFIGLGGGAARVAIEGEIVDQQTKQVLVRFTQERRATKGKGMFGGNAYDDVLNNSLESIGKDVAKILNAF